MLTSVNKGGDWFTAYAALDILRKRYIMRDMTTKPTRSTGICLFQVGINIRSGFDTTGPSANITPVTKLNHPTKYYLSGK